MHRSCSITKCYRVHMTGRTTCSGDAVRILYESASICWAPSQKPVDLTPPAAASQPREAWEKQQADVSTVSSCLSSCFLDIWTVCGVLQEANLLLQCERWQHLQWRFLNCKLEEAMATAKPKVRYTYIHISDLMLPEGEGI